MLQQEYERVYLLIDELEDLMMRLVEEYLKRFYQDHPYDNSKLVRYVTINLSVGYRLVLTEEDEFLWRLTHGNYESIRGIRDCVQVVINPFQMKVITSEDRYFQSYHITGLTFFSDERMEWLLDEIRKYDRNYQIAFPKEILLKDISQL